MRWSLVFLAIIILVLAAALTTSIRHPVSGNKTPVETTQLSPRPVTTTPVPVSPVQSVSLAPTPRFSSTSVSGNISPSKTMPSVIPTAYARSDPYPFPPSTLAHDIHMLINQERTRAGLQALSEDPVLAGIALAHSQDMAAYNYFSHVDQKGEDPTARGESVGYTCRKDFDTYYTYGIAENIFQNNLYSSVTYFSDGTFVYAWDNETTIAKTTVAGWMNSSGHRQNILTSTFDREGLGVAISSDDKVYITEDFC